MLIVFRFLQGCVSSGMLTIPYVAITDVAPVNIRRKCLSWFAVIGSIGYMLGPILSTALEVSYGWRQCFLIHFPFVLLGGMLICMSRAPNFIPKSSANQRDVWSCIFLVGFVFSLQWILAMRSSWDDYEIPMGMSCVGCFVMYVALDSRAPENAIIPWKLIGKHTNFKWILLLCFVNSNILYGFLTYAPLVTKNLLNPSLGVSGWAASIIMLVLTFTFIPANLFIAKKNHTIVIAIGAFVGMIGSFALGFWMEEMSTAVYFSCLGIIGISLGCLSPMLNVILQTTVASSEMATATTCFFFVRQVGGSIGIAIQSSILDGHYDRYRFAYLHWYFFGSYLICFILSFCLKPIQTLAATPIPQPPMIELTKV